MTQPKPTQKFVFTHPTDADGNEIKFRFMLSLSKQVKDVEGELQEAIGTLDGIDFVATNVGRYTLEISIARTFDPDEVIAELKRRLENNVLSDIIRPSQDIVIP